MPKPYSYAWEQAAARHKWASPLCITRQAEGTVKSAEVVDHIVPHQGDDALMWDEANYQAPKGQETDQVCTRPSWTQRDLI